MDVGGKMQNLFSEGVNKGNDIVFSYESKTGDGSGYNSKYNFYEVIKVPFKALVKPDL